jgi:hypothetical protein
VNSHPSVPLHLELLGLIIRAEGFVDKKDSTAIQLCCNLLMAYSCYIIEWSPRCCNPNS